MKQSRQNPITRAMPHRLFTVLAVLFMMAHSFGRLQAQESADRFDPVVFIATLNIFQAYGEGVFALPPNAERFFVDTLRMYEEPVAFTIVTRDKNPEGWVLRMDFDAGRFGTIVLTAVSARKALQTGDTTSFRRLERWAEHLLGGKIMEKETVSASRIAWKWMPRYGYVFEIFRSEPAVSGASMLHIRLRSI